MSNSTPKLGDRVKDCISGFVGIVISHAQHLTGCDRMFLEPGVDKDNKTHPGMWVDIDMLDIVEAGVVKRVEYAPKLATTGGTDLPPSR